MTVEDLRGLITPLPLDASSGVPGRKRCLTMYEEQKKFAAGPVGSVPAERRTHPRYPCTSTAEIVDTGSGARILGRTSDISRGGCYVDTINPFPVGTLVKIQLTKDEQSFVALGTVVYGMSGLGMGLMFTSVDPEQLRALQRWITELGRMSGTELEVGAPEPESRVCSVAEKNGKNEQYYVLNELIISLMRKGVLTDAEGKAMLEKLLR
jgi:PilZ domain